MPIHRVKGGYKWGNHGHVYPTKKGAEKQEAAIYANGYKGDAQDGEVEPGTAEDIVLKAVAADSRYKPK